MRQQVGPAACELAQRGHRRGVLGFERLPACWPNHPEAVTELSNVMTEWARVYGDPANRDLAAALIWHDRWLPGVLSRLMAAVKCDAAGCRRLPKPWERAPPSYS